MQCQGRQTITRTSIRKHLFLTLPIGIVLLAMFQPQHYNCNFRGIWVWFNCIAGRTHLPALNPLYSYKDCWTWWLILYLYKILRAQPHTCINILHIKHKTLRLKQCWLSCWLISKAIKTQIANLVHVCVQCGVNSFSKLNEYEYSVNCSVMKSLGVRL